MVKYLPTFLEVGQHSLAVEEDLTVSVNGGGFLFVGVLMIRAVVFGVSIRPPDVWKLPSASFRTRARTVYPSIPCHAAPALERKTRAYSSDRPPSAMRAPSSYL